MLMTVISLAISLVSMSGFYSAPQQESSLTPSPNRMLDRQVDKPATDPDLVTSPIELGVPQPAPLPPGDNSWTIRIVSRGGLTGSGRGDLSVTSDGVLFWSGADGVCARQLADETLQALSKIILGPSSPNGPREAYVSVMCGDCYLTIISLQRRDTRGLSGFTVEWDDATQARVSTDIIAIYEAVMAHKGCEH
jgi:hypothetical protein